MPPDGPFDRYLVGTGVFEPQVEQGSTVPLRLGSSEVVATISLRNITKEKVRLIDARPSWTSDGSRVRRFMVSPPGEGNAGLASGISEPGAVPLHGAVIGPSRDDEDVLLSFDLLAPRRGRNELLLGIDVLYEQDGHRKAQRWPLTILTCPWPDADPTPAQCNTFQGLDVHRLGFDGLLAAVQKDG